MSVRNRKKQYPRKTLHKYEPTQDWENSTQRSVILIWVIYPICFFSCFWTYKRIEIWRKYHQVNCTTIKFYITVYVMQYCYEIHISIPHYLQMLYIDNISWSYPYQIFFLFIMEKNSKKNAYKKVYKTDSKKILIIEQ